MRTMKEQRIVWILSELSSRVAEYNTTMSDLISDFNHSRRPSMQIRKDAKKCIRMADVMMCRFLAIASANHFDEDCAMVETFHKRRTVFNELELFFH